MKKVLVVGGGIAGIYSSILLQKKGYQVTLVDSAPKLGGLLNSIDYENGDTFDYGTHFIAGAEDPEIDSIILNEQFQKTWNKFPNEYAGNFFANQLTDNCIFVHAQKLPREEYVEGLADLVEALPCDDQNSENSEEQLIKRFGKGFTNSVYKPALTKLFGVESLKDLIVGAHRRFGMKRIVVGSPESSRELKKSAYLDDKIAFHQFSEGSASRPQYYPKDHGAQEWIKYLQEDAEALGVKILTSTNVTNIEYEGKDIKSATLNGEEKLSIDQLVWTAPLFFLAKAASLDIKMSPPILRRTTLLNYTFNKAPKTPCHFFFCYDPNYLAFRVTLYSNLQPEKTEKTGRHRVTVEVLSSPKDSSEEYLNEVKKQLINMKIFDEDVETLFQDKVDVPNGFPVLTHQFQSDTEKLESEVDKTFNNLTRAGRATSKTWFMSEVFKDVHQKIGQL